MLSIIQFLYPWKIGVYYYSVTKTEPKPEFNIYL